MKLNLQYALAWTSYPGVMLALLALHGFLLESQSLLVAAYIPVLLGVVTITLLEMINPERLEWRPTKGEVVNDAAYMLIVQVLLPRLLAFAFALMLIDPLHARGWVLEGYWPHDWPVWLQALLMVLVADFFRYWLHRFAHRFGFLWRFHAVHHSVPKLYWLNVGRFHYIDKSLQFLFDVLPFILLGVDEKVLALYFVFYAINGFFQHSNVKLRMGVLNYVISSAELHRWHHSRLVKESDTNFGNNLIIWDIVFGTRFLPDDRTVGTLGLFNHDYPNGFLAQLRTPYIGGMSQHEMPMLDYVEILRNGLIKLGMLYNHFVLWHGLIKACQKPGQVQRTLLKLILSGYANTRFGKEHGFAQVGNYSDYVRLVKVQTYEDLRPYIDKQIESGEPILNPVKPIMYALTSGTTGRPKLIPVLPETLVQQRRNQRIFSYLQYRESPEAFNGKMLGIMGSPVEGILDDGTPYGSVSGLLYMNMPRIMHGKYVVPPEVFDIADYELKYLVILRLAMQEKGITYMGGANPSTFLRLHALMNTHAQQLIDDIEQGTFFREHELTPSLSAILGSRIHRDAGRAKELRVLLFKGSLRYSNAWPYLQLLSTWTGGSCGVSLNQLMGLLPKHTRVTDLGYIASEFRGSVPLSSEAAAGIPLLQDNFYEFVLKADWESGRPVFRLLDELEQGEEYYVFITTTSGLFRYQMDDIVRVTGHFDKAPLIQFIQKGAGITNITGEKLYENQVIDAMQASCNELQCEIPFYLVLADRQNAVYELYVEMTTSADDLVRLFDRYLSQLNVEYTAKRQSGRLGAVKAVLLKPDTYESYKQWMLQNGQREGQYKPVLLKYKDDVKFPVDEYILK